MLARNRSNPKSVSSHRDQVIYPSVKYSLELEPPQLSAREFCRKMHGLDDLPEEDILRAEMQSNYRKHCIGLLSRALGLKLQSVYNWGEGLDFPKMPQIHERFLGMYYERSLLIAEIKRLRRFIA
ncbi:hypothetical protein PCC7424_2435 [Gloeothece citriformis PCC 7424]|uniref:Uncharacterized protein n=1 Tax=Gloeothece citriformis (strain PCC 7424) TaxID=65393 RepID=B7KJ19_GLOC7|nr:hypothetical protein [Gloeothece citriformis]ACK70855.1 hypothetical protein PCC7424_2435 [Gloeothece citriformis PCC 7424]